MPSLGLHSSGFARAAKADVQAAFREEVNFRFFPILNVQPGQLPYLYDSAPLGLAVQTPLDFERFFARPATATRADGRSQDGQAVIFHDVDGDLRIGEAQRAHLA